MPCATTSTPAEDDSATRSGYIAPMTQTTLDRRTISTGAVILVAAGCAAPAAAPGPPAPDLPECERRAGSLYTATGTEPGWRLTIGPARLRLEADYGERVVETATPIPQSRPDGTSRYRTDAGDRRLTVEIEPRYCENAMSGKAFPDTVSVTLDGERFDGCGGDPVALLTGRPWRIDTLNGAEVAPEDAPTIEFAGDGSVAGFDGCNRFHGRFRITGVGIEFRALATTRMACPGRRDGLAQRFLEGLADAELFRLDDDGRLILGSHGQTEAIIAVRIAAG